MNPLTVALLGAAQGSAFVHYAGYSGGPITPAIRERLHAGLDHAIALANSHANEPKSNSRAINRRR